MRLVLFCLLIMMPISAPAQTEVSVYSGTELWVSGRISGHSSGGGEDFGYSTGWQDPFSPARRNFGLRLTLWQDNNFGWGVEYNERNFRADAPVSAEMTGATYSENLQLLTLNAFYRWKKPSGNLVPYVGAGLGLAMPDAEFSTTGQAGSDSATTGPAAQWVVGASYPIARRVSVFGEYQGSYSMSGAGFSNEGAVNTRVITGAVNIGLTLGF